MNVSSVKYQPYINPKNTTINEHKPAFKGIIGEEIVKGIKHNNGNPIDIKEVLPRFKKIFGLCLPSSLQDLYESLSALVHEKYLEIDSLKKTIMSLQIDNNSLRNELYRNDKKYKQEKENLEFEKSKLSSENAGLMQEINNLRRNSAVPYTILGIEEMLKMADSKDKTQTIPLIFSQLATEESAQIGEDNNLMSDFEHFSDFISDEAAENLSKLAGFNVKEELNKLESQINSTGSTKYSDGKVEYKFSYFNKQNFDTKDLIKITTNPNGTMTICFNCESKSNISMNLDSNGKAYSYMIGYGLFTDSRNILANGNGEKIDALTYSDYEQAVKYNNVSPKEAFDKPLTMLQRYNLENIGDKIDNDTASRLYSATGFDIRGRICNAMEKIKNSSPRMMELGGFKRVLEYKDDWFTYAQITRDGFGNMELNIKGKAKEPDIQVTLDKNGNIALYKIALNDRNHTVINANTKGEPINDIIYNKIKYMLTPYNYLNL